MRLENPSSEYVNCDVLFSGKIIKIKLNNLGKKITISVSQNSSFSDLEGIDTK